MDPHPPMTGPDFDINVTAFLWGVVVLVVVFGIVAYMTAGRQSRKK